MEHKSDRLTGVLFLTFLVCFNREGNAVEGVG